MSRWNWSTIWLHFFGWTTVVGCIFAILAYVVPPGTVGWQVFLGEIRDSIGYILILLLLIALCWLLAYRCSAMSKELAEKAEQLLAAEKEHGRKLEELRERQEEAVERKLKQQEEKLQKEHATDVDALHGQLADQAKNQKALVEKARSEGWNKALSEQPKRVVLFVPRENRSGFFWQRFEIEVVYALSEKGYYCLVQAIDGNYDEASQINRLIQFPWTEVCGAIIAPAGPGVIPTIASILKDKKTPLVIHDTTVEAWRGAFRRHPVTDPSCASVDNEKGGRMAAVSMLKWLTVHRPGGNYSIWCIPGNSAHRHSRERVASFRQEWPEEQGTVVTLPDGGWTAGQCKKMFREYMNRRVNDQRLKPVDGIFACNDEMALAVMRETDTLMAGSSSDAVAYRRLFAQTVFVGFDRTDEAFEELSNPTTRFIATIDAKISEQATEVVDRLHAEILDPDDDTNRNYDPIDPWPVER